MRRSAVSSSSIALSLMMVLAAGTAKAVDGQAGSAAPLAQRLAIPPLTPAESRAAFAPVGPASSVGRAPVLPEPDRTATLGNAPLPAEPEPEAAAPAPMPLPVARPFNAAELAAAAARPPAPIAVLAAVSPAPAAAPGPTEPDVVPAPAAAPGPTEPDIATAPAAAEPTPAPAEPGPAATAPSLPDATAQTLRDRLASAANDPTMRMISAFYALRGDKPAWIENGVVTDYAKAGLERLSRADEDGLDPHAFAVPDLDGLGPGADAERLAAADIAISSAFVTYARQAANGRVNARSISGSIVPTANPVDPAEVLTSLAIAADPAAVLDGYNPVHPQYLALKKKLAELKAEDADMVERDPPRVPPGPTLKVGMEDQRVAVLRSRLGLTLIDGDDVYDDALADAVRSFQKERRLKATGTLGPQTIAALNFGLPKPRLALESEIVSNMERWRWLPRDLGTSHVLVNIPEYRLHVTMDGQEIHEAKVIVGKPGTPTPVFSDIMQFVVLNPSWNVPQSIIRKEYLPKLMEDPDYLAKRGFVVTYRNGQMSVRQPPGDDNALGHIKFMFPNNFSVYLHDTSSRNLFTSEKRAFSHGCVRVDAPFEFAEIVMGAENGWTADRVESAIGGRERRIDLKRQIPVHIAYFTATVDDSGELQLYDDIYGYDQRVMSALGLNG
jgi:murein L,D-transpeptidase YcbB/YkuD